MSKKGKKVAEVILKLRRDQLDLVRRNNFGKTEHEMHWPLSEASMPYRDCLEAMKRGGLISNYNLVSDTAVE